MAHPVTRQELVMLLNDAHRATSGAPGLALMRERAIDVLTRALSDRRSVYVHEVDAIVAAARETGDYRARHQLADPYAERRARCIQICTRLRAELIEAPARWRDPRPATKQSDLAVALGTRIRAARRDAGLTQAQLAHKLEVNQTTVARWEAGVLVPNHRHRWRLADMLGGRPAHYEE